MEVTVGILRDETEFGIKNLAWREDITSNERVLIQVTYDHITAYAMSPNTATLTDFFHSLAIELNPEHCFLLVDLRQAPATVTLYGADTMGWYFQSEWVDVGRGALMEKDRRLYKTRDELV